ncbi:ribose ABC transporter ATP binding subunit [Paraburkholderia sacchari]|uniref:sugar ABC transporter ATP-binding protein n=1 Tax=Paraburkholderia sacchari TaxID=159450 RepID=UPI0039A4AC09
MSAVEKSHSNAGGVEMNSPILEVSGISKSFPGVRALNAVNFSVRPGEVHALCGENGAGKSTLMRILAGGERPDSGAIILNGHKVSFRGPLDAKQAGILLIHQELSLVPEMSVEENIFLGSLPRKSLGRLDKKELREHARKVLGAMKYAPDPDAKVGDLSIAQQQMVEIARADAFSASVIIFDEPTASLTESEAEVLLDKIRELKSKNVAVVYISHKLNEVLDISDRITILRDGEVQATISAASADADQITRLMVGRSLDHYYQKGTHEFGSEALRVEGLHVGVHARDITFRLRAGEVVGFYGLVGAGRSETVEAIFGARRANQGKLFWEGREVKIRSTRDAMALGIGLVPESRKSQGLVLGMGSRHNMSLSLLDGLHKFQFLQRRREGTLYEDYRGRLRIAAADGGLPVQYLSGGNQQKVVIAKWLARNPRLLILDEPTRGVDVGAKAEIHQLVAQLSAQGMAVLVVSSEMPEIIGLSHRVLTFYHGQITGEFAGTDITEQNLIAGAMGQQTEQRL